MVFSTCLPADTSLSCPTSVLWVVGTGAARSVASREAKIQSDSEDMVPEVKKFFFVFFTLSDLC